MTPHRTHRFFFPALYTYATSVNSHRHVPRNAAHQRHINPQGKQTMARMMPTVVYFDSESWSPRAQRARTIAGLCQQGNDWMEQRTHVHSGSRLRAWLLHCSCRQELIGMKAWRISTPRPDDHDDDTYVGENQGVAGDEMRSRSDCRGEAGENQGE